MWFKPLDDAPAHAVTTSDGWTLRVREYAPAYAPAAGGAVLLLHGLGASHHNFDLHPYGPSLARWLAGRGRRVFVGELRGRDGASRRARTWTFSDYLLRDLPALTAFARERAAGPLHFVGHSMGGILGLSHAALTGGEGLASMTTVGTALHYGVGGSSFQRGLAWKRRVLTKLERMPSRLVHRVLGPLWALKLLPARHYRRENMDARAVLAFHNHAPVDITIAELLELSTTFAGEGILCQELGRRLPELAARQPAPWLCVGGTLDRQCPPGAVEWTFQRLSAPRKELVFCRDYGHFDLIGGRHAERDVFPTLERFLASTER